MSSRTRPEGCCPPEPVPPLRAIERDRWVAIFRALGDPTRLELLRLLGAQPGPTCACDLVGHFALGQPTISHHLRILREAGLLTQSRVGIWSFYACDPQGMAQLARLADAISTGQSSTALAR